MHNELTNLLPPMRRRALRYDYFIRLSVIGMILFTSLLLASSVLLLPTYVFLIKNASAEKTHLASIESTSSSFDEAALSAQLAALSKSAGTLSAFAGARSVSATMSAFLTISRPGITLSGFVYSLPTGKNPSTLAISGTAATREALRSYQLALDGAPLARSANLPVSAYAKDTDITFTITMTLSP